MAHKWRKEICAWAEGKRVLYRVQRSNGVWSEWYTLSPEVARFDSSLTMELRIADEPVPHKWQVQKEAYLAGLPVEFRGIGEEAWIRVDEWAVSTAIKDPSCKTPLWDRSWLEFRLMEGEQKTISVGVSPNGGLTNDANLRVTFIGKDLRMAEVLR